MGLLIIIVSIILFIVLIKLTWNRLNNLETKQKIIACTLGIIVSLLITSIIFFISSIGIEYKSQAGKQAIMRIILLIFTPINGMSYMPYFAKIIGNVKYKKTSKEKTTAKLTRCLIISLIIFIIEIIYLKNMQKGIIEYANQMIQ